MVRRFQSFWRCALSLPSSCYTCGPEGYGSSSAASEAAAMCFQKCHILSQNGKTGHFRAPFLLLPQRTLASLVPKKGKQPAEVPPHWPQFNGRTPIVALTYRSSDKSSPAVVLPGPAPPRTWYPKPFFRLPLPLPHPHPSPTRPFPLPAPLALPTSFHNVLVSSRHVMHSSNRYSLVCLPVPHSIHPKRSLRKGVVT